MIFSPGVVKQYCNGSKIPPEAGSTAWYQVPPGTFEGNVPVPVFSLTAGATVDEGNNWVNISWGPLSLIAPTSEGSSPLAELPISDYSLASGSPAINYINLANSPTSYNAAPIDDFNGSLRKSNGAVDAGAVEFASNVNSPLLSSVAPNSGARGATVNVTLTGQYLTGASAVTVSSDVTVSNIVVVNDTTVTATFTVGRPSNANLGLRSVSITTPGGTVTLNNSFRIVGAQNVTFTATGLNTGGRTLKHGVITVTNLTGGTNQAPLILTGTPTVTRTGGSGTFTVTGGTCISGTTVNAGGGSCTVNVDYQPPAAPASVTATMRVNLPNTGAATDPLQSGSITGN